LKFSVLLQKSIKDKTPKFQPQANERYRENRPFLLEALRISWKDKKVNRTNEFEQNSRTAPDDESQHSGNVLKKSIKVDQTPIHIMSIFMNDAK
jgi:hypothetical protein